MDNKEELVEMLKCEIDFLIRKARNSGLSCLDIVQITIARLNLLLTELETMEYWFRSRFDSHCFHLRDAKTSLIFYSSMIQ